MNISTSFLFQDNSVLPQCVLAKGVELTVLGWKQSLPLCHAEAKETDVYVPCHTTNAKKLWQSQ